MNPKLESMLLGEKSTTSDMQMMAESKEELKNFLMKVKEESGKKKKTTLNLNIKKLRSWHLVSSLRAK